MGQHLQVLPCSIQDDWVDVTGLTPSTADNSGSTVVAPAALVNATTRPLIRMDERGTSIQVRLKYPVAATTPVGPTVQVFGVDSTNASSTVAQDATKSNWQRLLSSGSHQLALTVDTTNDVQVTPGSTAFAYTQPVELDADGHANIFIAVKTAMTGTGITGSTVQVKRK